MALMLRHLPSEIQSARETLASARRDALPTKRARDSRVALYLALLLVGTVAGATLVSFDIVRPTDYDFWRSGLTAVSILSGFIVATMVFTGKIDAAKSLSLTELREVTLKCNYLLLFQLGTIANHLFCLSLMLLVPAFANIIPIAAPSLAALGIGLFFVSIVRSFFIPLQIIELHRFTHAALLREKREETKNNSDL